MKKIVILVVIICLMFSLLSCLDNQDNMIAENEIIDNDNIEYANNDANGDNGQGKPVVALDERTKLSDEEYFIEINIEE